MAYRGTHPQPPARRGFTLIEIIVVVVIIVALMAILIPALGGARKTARKAAGLAQMQGISQAIDSFYTEFHALPGPLSTAQIATATDFSDSQNLLVALSRRYWVNTAPPPPPVTTQITVGGSNPAMFVSNDTTKSPVDLSPYGTATDKPYEAYLNPKADEMNKSLDNGASSTINTVQVFVDNKVYPSAPLPILYFRQTRKYDPSVGSMLPVADSSGNAAFYSNTNLSLANSSGPVFNNFPSLKESNLDNFLKTTSNNYLRSALFETVPGSTVSYRQKGSYVLISPGLDRIYGDTTTAAGTVVPADDIIVSGGL